MENKRFLTANWKLHFDLAQAINWLEVLAGQKVNLAREEVVVCPSFPLLFPLEQEIRKEGLDLKLGAQNISHFQEGAYTGEVGIHQLPKGVKYVIVGHSERRRYFRESDDDIVSKARLALRYALTPIICVSSESQIDFLSSLGLPAEKIIIAFEPLSAIGSGRPENPLKAASFACQVKSTLGEATRVIYGGSVNSKTAPDFLACQGLGGFLVGGASLDPVEFGKLVGIVSGD